MRLAILLLLLAPAVLAAPAPSLSGPGVSTSSAAFASPSASGRRGTSNPKYTFLPLVHIYLISHRAQTQGDNVFGLMRPMREFAEAVAAALDGTSDDPDPAYHEKFYAAERSYLLQDLATLQQEVSEAATPEAWSPEEMRFELTEPSKSAVAGRRPRPSDFAPRKLEKAEHEEPKPELESRDLEFKP